MTRLPFDPDRAAGGGRDDQGAPGLPVPAERSELGPARRERRRFAEAAAERQLTVSEATELIKSTLEDRMPSPLRVVGEVSNLSTKNHWYFSLKDEASVLHCVAWATAIRRFGFQPRDGDQVVATGHIGHYPPQGRTQMYVSELAPMGAGTLERRFRALCEELRGLGYFDEARKKPLPFLPRRIAVITSATGAALQDVIHTAAQRCKAVGLTVVDVPVQGEGAAIRIARAVRWIDRHHKRLGVDAMLVTRGGGSIEDLWAFNERMVADAVYQCTLPVVAAIGHESDTTIIELVADVRASTPTQAAMKLIPASQELCRQLDHLMHRLGLMLARAIETRQLICRQLCGDLQRIMRGELAAQRNRLHRLVGRLSELQPRAQIARRQARLAVAADRLHRAMPRRIERLRDRLAVLERSLTAKDPHRVLARGYSLTTHSDGTLIRSVAQVKHDDRIQTRVADGVIDSTVGRAATGLNGQAGRSARPSKRRAAAGQMDLFAAGR